MVVSVEALSMCNSDGLGETPEAQPNIMVLTKNATIPRAETSLSREILEWKRAYWRKRIGGIKSVVAPMVDQR